ncbi:helix-turn-helix transcriptional regulator [Curvivirga sp.]|uniref:helix-turn-helix transcriptional regulator n=1 Tax=Curvivirga sp. TaxID=2856848 RepID=UPI003B5ADD4E
MIENFSKNLRSLCADYGSMAHICREIGINRQQFNRYVNGAGMPSAHNLRRIARYFKVSEESLMLDHEAFVIEHINQKSPNTTSPLEFMADVFKNQAKHLRRYLGVYHAHFISPSWEGHIMRSLFWLREEDGVVVSHSNERASNPDSSVIMRTRYDGLVAFRGNKIYLVERSRSDDGVISETILFPAHRQQIQYLRGLSFGVAFQPQPIPFNTKIIWKRVPTKITAREAIAATGIFPFNSPQIDPVVKKYLLEDNENNFTTTRSL